MRRRDRARCLGWLLLGCMACCSKDAHSPSPGTVLPPVVALAGSAAPAATSASLAPSSAGALGAIAGGGSGASGTGVAAGAGASGGAGQDAGAGTGGSSSMDGGAGRGALAGTGGLAGSAAPATTAKFSFFVTSLAGMRELSKNEQGFGGDLRHGAATGLAGADKICTELADKSLPGAGSKGWHAFLSAAKGGPSGGPVHARDRIGNGPWYDRTGRLVAPSLTALLNDRPMGADAVIVNDLPNERGEPNHTDTVAGMDDNHDVVTASNAQGMWDGDVTCSDWTSIETPLEEGGGGMFNLFGPQVGHSWPAQGSGTSWMSAHSAPGCAPSVSLVQTGPGSGTGIGNGGGYGGIYCFAMMP